MFDTSRFTVDSLSQKKAKISKGTHPWRLSTFEDFTTEVQFVESQPDSERMPGEPGVRFKIGTPILDDP